MDKQKLLDVLREHETYYRKLKNDAESEQEEYYAVGRMDSYTMLIHDIERGMYESKVTV